MGDRRKLVLGNKKIYTNLKEIIGLAHDNRISLVVFRPAEILEFVAETAEPEWPRDKINGILNRMKQGHLFEDQNLEDFKIMPKLPYKFSYRFKDDAGVESKLMIEDWEIGQLYWNCEKYYGKDQAVPKVRQKYMDDFVRTEDLYLFLGTTYEWHVRKAKKSLRHHRHFPSAAHDAGELSFRAASDFAEYPEAEVMVARDDRSGTPLRAKCGKRAGAGLSGKRTHPTTADTWLASRPARW